MAALDRIRNLHDLKHEARKRLPRGIFEFIDRGAEDEQALRANEAALAAVKFAPRVMIDVSRRSCETSWFGRKQSMPVALAPTGAAGLVYYNGELELARAAAAAGVPFALATRSMTPMETIAEQAGGTLWFQLYLWASRELAYELVARAKAAGFHALIVTVDTPVMPNREYNARNGFGLPFRLSSQNFWDLCTHPRWLVEVMLRYLLTTGMPRYENSAPMHRTTITKGGQVPSSMRSDDVTWDDLRVLRDRWPGALLVKGVLRPDDAERAIAMGADGIIVSNHGGRALDAAVPAISALPDIAAAVGRRGTVLVDGAFRRGGDVAKALALGASGVLVGRPALFGAAVAGQAGVGKAFEILRGELLAVMAMLGCASIEDVTPDLVATPSTTHTAHACSHREPILS
jgi:isopentenyl diphosphate isomerase/L-lactate dehydrogenase-like FMN-dependent dehydrogenase